MNKRKGMFLLLIVLLLVTVGFALLSRKLNIFGTSNITAASWNIHWDNVANQKGVEASTPAYIKDTAKTIVEYEVYLAEPGDFYEFTVDAVNEGTMDGKITKIESTVNGEDISTLPSYITYSVSYLEGGTPALGDILTKKVGNTPGKKTYKIRVEYDADLVTETDLDDMPNDGLTLVFEYDVTYSQSNPMEVEPVSFADDPWDVIASCANNPNCPYEVGDTKDIEMDLDGDNTPETYRLRIANTSTPDICNTPGFSQSACGLVLEFEDVIAEAKMNLYQASTTETSNYQNPSFNVETDVVNGTGNYGGWEYSNMRAYLNGTVYAKDNINYSSTGFINKLPQDLRNVIKDTRVVSGYGCVARNGGTCTIKDNNGNNFVTTDKIFLFAPREIWNFEDPNADGIYYDAGYYGNTRQLDYYASVASSGIYPTSEGAAKNPAKTGIYNAWWLRTARSDNNNYFFYVFTNGTQGTTSASYNMGLSPAFRVGN